MLNVGRLSRFLSRLGFGSAALRGALAITVVAALTTAVAFSVHYQRTITILEDEYHTRIRGDLEATRSALASGGPEAVTALIATGRRFHWIRDRMALVIDPDGRISVGDAGLWPHPLVLDRWQVIEVPVAGNPETPARLFEAYLQRLPDGTVIGAARGAKTLISLRRGYFRDLLGALLVTGVTGLIIGWLVSQRGLRFLRAYTATARRFLDEDDAARIEISQWDDEFDRLGRLINDTMDRVTVKTTLLRTATDSLAHDLKTPLTRIRARVELALLRGPTQQSAVDVLAMTLRDLDGQLELINAMLQLTRAEAVTSDQFQLFDTGALARDAFETFLPVAEDKGVHVDLRNRRCLIKGVRPLVAQAIANLVDNAIKYTPSGGHIQIALSNEGAYVRIRVADSGPGIPLHLRDKVKDRFVRLDESHASGGVGLGLSLATTVARVHRGRLELGNNQPGLTADLYLPAAADDAATGHSGTGPG